MRSLFLVATISALAWARPETYRETEDFQYARSSSDEGSKSGYYGAQRGNMAGNYERAHNMDSLAQHQMSGAVNQVEGELGDASKTRAGSVYTAANSRGVYGSGHHDLSNLQGRNFGESSSVDSSHSSLSSAYNQHSQNSDWRSHSQRTGFGASDQIGQASLRAGDTGYGASGYGESNSHTTGYKSSSGHNSQSGYRYRSNYDQSNLNGQSSDFGAGDQSRRYTIVTPVRLVGRPGTQIAIPVYAQAYDTQRSSSLDQSSSSQNYASQRASAFDQNAVNSEAEVLNNNQQHTSSFPRVPTTDGKHYSSSYNYRKAWERRSETTDLPVPVAPTVSPLPKHSELYEDVQGASGSANLQQGNSQHSYSGSAYNAGNRHNSYLQSESSQSGHQSDYSSQHKSQSDANSNAYTQGTYGSHSGLSSLVDTQPKSYQSSYSYHKSWEKQGDPYVIVPATNGEPSQRIVSGTKNSASAQHYNSQSDQHYSQGRAVDCDTLCRVRRAVRSYRTEDYFQQNQEDLGQQAQRGWNDLGQQSQNLEDLGQQTQQSWGNFQQQSQPQKLEDLGQHTQEPWGNLQQQSRPQKLEDLGQQTQQSWGNFQQQSLSQKQEDLGQQTQESWGNLQQQSRPQKLEDLGQQTQQSWGNIQQQSQPQKLEDFGQQTQGKWQEFDQESQSNLEDLGQQTQHSWDKSNTEQQESRQNQQDLGQQTQDQWDKMETDSQQSQHFQQTFTNLDNLGQHTQSGWENIENLGQQTQQNWNGLGNLEQQNKPQQIEELEQQTQNKWETTENLGQQVQTQWHNINTINKTRHTDTTNTVHQTQTQFESVDHTKPNRVHAEDTQYNLNNENSNIYNPNHPAFWTLTNEQRHENTNHYNQQHSHNYNSSYNSQNYYGASWPELQGSNNNAQTTNNYPLISLWDKIDNMEQQSEHTSNENQQHGYENSQNSYYGQESTYHHESNWEHGHNSSYTQDHHETHDSGYQPPNVFNNSVNKPKNDQQYQSTTEKAEDDELPDKPQAAEIGRGDIGPEDDSSKDVTTQKTVTSSQTYSIQMKPEKTLEEIEALSLSRGTDQDSNQSDTLSVLSISQQKWLEDQRRRVAHEHLTSVTTSRSTTTSTTTSRTIIKENGTLDSFSERGQGSTNNLYFNNHNKKPENESKLGLEQPEEIYQQNTQQNQNLNQQNLQQFENLGHHGHNFDQQNTQQEPENFGQQSQDLYQNNLNQKAQHSQNLDHQNSQQWDDFGHQSQQNVEQQNQNFDQQSTGQGLVDFGQQSQDLSQQDVQQLENLGQHSQNFDQENTGQQLLDFGQQTQDLNQHNLQQFENSAQHGQYFEQQSTGQQLEDFGQQSQDLNQQNLKQFEDLGQQHQNLDQHQAREFMPHSNAQPIQEQKITPVSDHGSQSNPKQEIEIVPPLVTATEKPGFWKSVGNKFTSAKDSVASWFKRS